MNRQDVEIDLLSDDELDGIAGGYRNLANPVVTTCLGAYCATAGTAATDYLMDKIQICA